MTRSHALAEAFSVLTGNPESRLAADYAARVVQTLSLHLDFVKLSASDVLVALKNARKRLVRGGRIHDYLHAVAAEKGLATKILTLDKYDFDDLTSHEVEVV